MTSNKIEEHECRFIAGSCICGTMLVKRRFVSMVELKNDITLRNALNQRLGEEKDG